MKIAKSQILSRKRSNPDLKFADHELTSFGGLIVFQNLFQSINLTRKLGEACRKLDSQTSHFYTHGKIFECIIVHLILGFRNLRDLDFYRDDPLVRQTLRLKTLPSVPTMSRMLSNIDEHTLANHHALNRDLVLDRLMEESPARVTIDFDGSVQSTTRHAEGTAVGFNKKKKGARSYYPLFCTIAQTSQIFKFHHRPGNVHDSNCAPEFVRDSINEIRRALPNTIIEVRMDSAFFSDTMIDLLEELGVEYTISVPFERFVELKAMIEERVFWFFTKGGKGKKIHYFEKRWKPKSWCEKRRFLFIATPSKVQRKGPLQLDLFEPVEEKEEYKVVVTNKKGIATNVVKYHEGRGSQEKIFGEGKDQLNMGYIPVRKRAGNEAYLLCGVIALNLTRELQMRSKPSERKTTAQRKALWVFEEMKTIRHKIIQTAGRLTRPQGQLTLTLPKNRAIEQAISQYLPT